MKIMYLGKFTIRRLLTEILILFITVAFLQKTFKNLKDNLKRCIDKRRNLTRSGAAASSLPKCKYFDVMRFLYDRVSSKPSESNLPQTVIRADMDDNQFLLGSSHSLSSCSATSPLPTDTVPSQKSMKRTSYVSTQSNSSTPLPKKQKVQTQKMDEQFFALMKAMNDDLIASIPQARETEEICEDTMYCKSLIPIMQGLPVRQKRLARMKIDKLLYELEFVDYY